MHLAVTLSSDMDEQESFPDLLKECTNQDQKIIGKFKNVKKKKVFRLFVCRFG